MKHLSVIVALVLIGLPFSVASQESASPGILSVEGVSGDVDVKGRDPILSFSKEVFSDSSRILVDAYVKNEGYSKYPIRFEFYVNNRLISNQIRSKELPGAIGITLDKSQYPIPYNFTIIASLITPNRNFNTAAYGAVTGSELSARLSCTLLLQTAGEDPIEYSAEGVAVGQSTDGSAFLNFTGTSVEGAVRTATANLAVVGQSATGTVSYEGTGDSGAAQVSGEATLTNGNLSAIDVSSVDGAVALACS